MASDRCEVVFALDCVVCADEIVYLNFKLFSSVSCYLLEFCCVVDNVVKYMFVVSSVHDDKFVGFVSFPDYKSLFSLSSLAAPRSLGSHDGAPLLGSFCTELVLHVVVNLHDVFLF